VESSELQSTEIITCSKCHEPKGEGDFYRQPSGKRKTSCKGCYNQAAKDWQARNPERHAANLSRWQSENQHKIRANSRRHQLKRYGLDQTAFDAMWAAQGGRCAICEQELGGTAETHIDHDHGTGTVRGLLCRRCNTGLGFFGDNAEMAMAAAEYLLRRRD
jgi:hypothetical protein